MLPTITVISSGSISSIKSAMVNFIYVIRYLHP
jgi:hypothetical protein